MKHRTGPAERVAAVLSAGEAGHPRRGKFDNHGGTPYPTLTHHGAWLSLARAQRSGR